MGKAHQDRPALFYLPAGVPELNADEYLHNDLKGRMNDQRLPNSKGELRSRIQCFLRRLLHPPEHVKSYFRLPASNTPQAHE